MSLTNDQSSRIKENLQRIAMAQKLASDAQKLVQEEVDAVYLAIEGMLNANGRIGIHDVVQDKRKTL